jgi:hypothetical protein
MQVKVAVGPTLRHANPSLVEGDPLPVRLRRSRNAMVERMTSPTGMEHA